MRYIRIFSELSNQMKYAAQKRILFEVALIKLCRPAMETYYNSLIDRIRLLEKRLESGDFVERKAEEPKKEKEPEPDKSAVGEPGAMAGNMQKVAEGWGEIKKILSPLLRTALISAKPSAGGDNVLSLSFTHELDRKVVEERLEEIKGAVQAVTGETVEVRVVDVQAQKEDGRGYPDLKKIIKNIPVEYLDE